MKISELVASAVCKKVKVGSDNHSLMTFQKRCMVHIQYDIVMIVVFSFAAVLSVL